MFWRYKQNAGCISTKWNAQGGVLYFLNRSFQAFSKKHLEMNFVEFHLTGFSKKKLSFLLNVSLQPL